MKYLKSLCQKKKRKKSAWNLRIQTKYTFATKFQIKNQSTEKKKNDEERNSNSI